MNGSILEWRTPTDRSLRPGSLGEGFGAHFQKSSEWGALTKEQLQRLDEVGVCRRYKAGEVLFHQGDKAQGVYYVRDGLVCIRKHDAQGNSFIIRRLAFAGNSIGLRPFLAEETNRSSAETLTPSTVCFVHASVVRDMIKATPDFGCRILKVMALALGAAEDAYFENVTMSADLRLAHLMLLLKDHYGKQLSDGSIMIDLPVSWRNISSLIGVRPESMSRVIRKLENDGVADFSGHTICWHHIERLLGELDLETSSEQLSRMSD